MVACDISTEATLHPVLAARFSPVRFDAEAVVTRSQIDTLLQAAQRAPSAGNSQPWRFVVAVRGDHIHARLVPHLARSSSQWAPSASVIIINIAHRFVEDSPDWEYSEFASYDLGQAVAHMTIQGLTLGLDSHQFRAFDRSAVTAEFAIPPHWEITSMTAFGRSAHAAGEETSPGTSRHRLELEDITWARAGTD